MTTAADLIQEIIDSHRFEKDGELLIEGIIDLYLVQSEGGREEFLTVCRNWLKFGDSTTADWAIALFRRLGLRSELPALERTLREVRDGKSKLPRYFEQFLVPAIEELKGGGD
jgi:hypothetical protein